MGHSIRIPNGIISMVDIDFKCPKCECPHSEEDYYDRLYKSKHGLIYKQCKGCKTKLGITTDIRGDVRVWLKEDERNGTRLKDVFNLNNDTMTTEQNEIKSAEWRKKNLSKNSSLANVSCRFYRGYTIRNHGYYPPDKCVWWEAVNDETGEADFHAKRLRDIISMINEALGVQDGS